jgi:hypothetical protein
MGHQKAMEKGLPTPFLVSVFFSFRPSTMKKKPKSRRKMWSHWEKNTTQQFFILTTTPVRVWDNQILAS